MPIVLNSNAAATNATFKLNQANDNLRRSIARLSSGSRITKPTDDAGGLAVAYKLQSSISRTEAALHNHQNALSFLQVQDGVLESIGSIVDRMAELRTMAADVSKNGADVENYSKEFLELQDQLNQMKREKFNGVELFATEEEWHTMKGVNKSHLKIKGADYVTDGSDAVAGRNAISLGTKQSYQYLDQPDEKDRVHSLYDKYEFELYTHPSGSSEDGNIKLNLVNLQFVLGLKDPSSFGVDKTQTWEGQDFISTVDKNMDGVITGTEWWGSLFDRSFDENFDNNELSRLELGYPGWRVENTGSTGIFSDAPGILDENYRADYEGYINSYSGLSSAYDSDPYRFGNDSKEGWGEAHWRLQGISEGRTLPQTFTGYNVSISNTVNLAGLNQVTLDPGDGSVHYSNNGTDYASWLTDDGYIKDITKVSVEEFTNIIEKIADVRAENGAVQASAAMVAQANQMTAIALTLLSQ